MSKDIFLIDWQFLFDIFRVSNAKILSVCTQMTSFFSSRGQNSISRQRLKNKAEIKIDTASITQQIYTIAQ